MTKNYHAQSAQDRSMQHMAEAALLFYEDEMSHAGPKLGTWLEALRHSSQKPGLVSK